MKSWDDLTTQERATAIGNAKALLIDLVIEGIIDLEMSTADLQASLEAILTKSRKAESPRLGMLGMLANKAINAELNRVAMTAAEGARYDVYGTLTSLH